MENWNQVRLESKRLVLRDIQAGDVEGIARYANNLGVSRFMQLLPYPYLPADALVWLNHCAAEQAKGAARESFSLAVCLKDGGELVGGISLNKFDRSQGTAGMGYWLGEPYWRKGLMYEAASAMLLFAFGELGVRRMDISAAVENEASNALIRKLGFVQEGVARQKLVPKATGKVHDLNVYGLLRHEWAAQRAAGKNNQ